MTTTGWRNSTKKKASGRGFPAGGVGGAKNSETGFYDMTYLGWGVLLVTLFLVLSYGVFLKKDIQFRS